ncbi:hypothetical protein ACFFRR_002063 [Megaselia abdita]
MLNSIVPSQDTYSRIFRGFLGFCYLALSQIFIQTKILVNVNREWKSSLMFQATSETRALYYLNYDQDSTIFSLVLSLAGTMNYFALDKYSWILLVPWIVNSTMHWISSSYICLKNILTSVESDDFWLTGGLTIMLISVKCLLLSEVVMNVLESALKILTCRKELKSMAKGSDEDDFVDEVSVRSFAETENSLHLISYDF